MEKKYFSRYVQSLSPIGLHAQVLNTSYRAPLKKEILKTESIGLIKLLNEAMPQTKFLDWWQDCQRWKDSLPNLQSFADLPHSKKWKGSDLPNSAQTKSHTSDAVMNALEKAKFQF